MNIYKISMYLLLNAVCLSTWGQTDSIGLVDSDLKSRSRGEWLEKSLNVISYDFFGVGSLATIFSEPEDLNSGINPTGTIGIAIESELSSLNLIYSLGTPVEQKILTLSQFGDAISSPNIVGNSFGASLCQMLSNKLFSVEGVKTGFYVDLRVSNNEWGTNSDSLLSASPFLFRTGLYIRPFIFNEEGVNLLLNLGYVHRSVQGDFRRTEQTIEGFDVNSAGYNGVDFAVTFEYGNFKLFARLYGTKTDVPILGLTGNQILLGLDFKAPLNGSGGQNSPPPTIMNTL